MPCAQRIQAVPVGGRGDPLVGAGRAKTLGFGELRRQVQHYVVQT